MYYLQQLRDEAHRFAITTHRNKRAKSVTKSSLDDIAGIGKTRKKALLNHFGSFDNVKTAVPIDALFTDTNTTYSAGTGITLSNGEFSADGSNINAGRVDSFHISTGSGTEADTIYFRT